MRGEQDGPVIRDRRTLVSVPARLASPRLLGEIAEAAVAGSWTRAALTDRLTDVVPADAADRLAGALLGHFPRAPWGSADRVVTELAALPALEQALAPPPITFDRPRPQPLWRWPVPRWSSVDEAAHGLDLDVAELLWLADPGGWLRRRPRSSDDDGGRHASRLRHYRYRWRGDRLLEAPKPLLAERQRRVRRRVLDALPVHPDAHGFVPGRSVTTFAAPHAGRGVVVRVDLEGFFSSITAARVTGLLQTAGYPYAVARLLAGVLTTATPVEVLRAGPAEYSDRLHRTRRRLAAAHLPQGAPSSPAVANLVAFGLDRRLRALADSRNLAYSRYADDLAFSGSEGPDGVDTVALRRTVARIVADEGFAVHPAKTRVMRSHRQQRLAGLVVNDAPAAPREDYDRLRAILHNAPVTGPAAQNRDGHPDFAAHLRGRIAWIATDRPARARTLLALFDRVDWGA